MRTQLFNSLKVSLLAIVLSFGMSYALAWTAPTAVPPTGNVSAPLNTSATAQTKAGTLAALNFITGSIQFLDGTVQATAASHGKQQFTSSGTFTVPTGVTTVWVSMSGGGGGGGGGRSSTFCTGSGIYRTCTTSSYSGARGGDAEGSFYIPISLTSSSIPVTVGNGGNGGGASASGSGGNPSSFGTLLSVTGGIGGGGNTAIPGPSPAVSKNRIFGAGYGSGSGSGGDGGVTSGSSGASGFVLVEW